MGYQSPAKLIQTGGALSASRHKTTLCRAFREAVEIYCTRPKGQRGRFNDEFFPKLKALDKKLADQIHREVPCLMGKSGSLPGVRCLWTAIGGSAALPSALANALLTASKSVFLRAFGTTKATGLTKAAPGQLDKIRGSLLGKLYGILRKDGGAIPKKRLRFPDGMMEPRQVIEIKGPGDSFKDPGQAKDYQKISSPDPPIVLSCESCRANCTSDGSGDGCPEQAKK